MPEDLYETLGTHLYPGDGDEHGAVIAAGMATDAAGNVRLLARDLYLARDGVDYVPGKRGYRMLRAAFVTERVLGCHDQKLVYLAIHNHGGDDAVGFSDDDLESHERGYPALLDIADGLPVGALVFAPRAVAGDIWLPGGGRVALTSATVVGRRRWHLTPAPIKRPGGASLLYDRQVRLFGAAGQAILRGAKVGIIGLGGVGALIAEYLGHLGVGYFILIDPDRVDPTNLPRLVGATRFDALTWFRGEQAPLWVRNAAQRWSAPKVRIARRVIRRANPDAKVDAIFGDVLEPNNAAALLGCDYLFLAADTMRARLLFNAIVHQYLIPGTQIGSKVTSDPASGELESVFSVTRPVTPDAGCLWCNGLISRSKLQEEAQTEGELRAQRYVDDPDVVAPSVITLNAAGAAQAVNDFLFYMTGLTEADANRAYRRYLPLSRETWLDQPRKAEDCPECGSVAQSRLGRGDGRRLPTFFRAS